MKNKDYYKESKRLRLEAIQSAEKLKDRPLHFSLSNGVDMVVEITKSDIKTIVSKNTDDNRFDAVK